MFSSWEHLGLTRAWRMKSPNMDKGYTGIDERSFRRWRDDAQGSCHFSQGLSSRLMREVAPGAGLAAALAPDVSVVRGGQAGAATGAVPCATTGHLTEGTCRPSFIIIHCPLCPSFDLSSSYPGRLGCPTRV